MAFLPPLPNLKLRAANVLSHTRRICTRMKMQTPPPIPLAPTIDVHIVPVLSDNFAYLIHDKATKTAALVDPVDPPKLLSLAESLHARVTSALITHHHWDHAGGNSQLASLVPGVEIVGSAYETAEAVNIRLETGQTRSITGSDLQYTALNTPCHTQGHLCFNVHSEQPAVFTGDTLFVGGCGKFFEGDAADMQKSLNETLASLPGHTLVFCGHEYTISNLTFARSVEGGNEVLKEKLSWAKQRVNSGLPTVPSSIKDEMAFNPFMRTDVAALAEAVDDDGKDPVSVMSKLRELKNNFRG